MALNERIMGAESSGNRFARNTRSSAYGPHQFLEGTWLELVRRYRPDLMQGRSRDELLALRSDEELSSEMSGHFNGENASYLAKRGLPADENSLYLAHFAGPAGAAKLLQNPEAPASQSLSADAIAANPFLKDWTGADVARWAERKMGWKPIAMPAATGEPLQPETIAPAPTPSAAPTGDKPVIPFLTELFASAMGSGAGAGAAGAAGAGGAGNLASMFGGENGGLLGSLFGENPIGGMMKSNQPDPTNPLAGAAQAPNMGFAPRMPVDMSGMQAMLSKRAPLNTMRLMG